MTRQAPIAATPHAVERYVERHRPGLSLHVAYRELLNEAAKASFHEHPAGEEAIWRTCAGRLLVVRSDGTITTVLPMGSQPANRRPQRSRDPQRLHNNALLRPGCQGDEVLQLQIQLKAAGYDCGEADGIYGPHTATAVHAFQEACVLLDREIAGFAGPLTRKALDERRKTPVPDPLPDLARSLNALASTPATEDRAQRVEQIACELMQLVPGVPEKGR